MYAHQRHRYGQEKERLLLWLWQVWKIWEVRLWQEIWLRLWIWLWLWEGEMRVRVCNLQDDISLFIYLFVCPLKVVLTKIPLATSQC